jgi:cyanophycinase-like exopeptidase
MVAGRSPNIADMVDEVVTGLSNARRVLAAGDAEERKAVVRTFLAGMLIESTAGSAVFTTVRRPATATD